MLWLFIIILGFILKLMENFYFIWLIGIFIVAPLVLYVAPKLYDEYKKRKGRSM